MSEGLDIQSTALDTQLDLHPKVKAAIQRQANRWAEKLQTCAPEDLRAIQARVQTYHEVLALPEQIRKKEQERRAAGQDISQPEDYAV